MKENKHTHTNWKESSLRDHIAQKNILLLWIYSNYSNETSSIVALLLLLLLLRCDCARATPLNLQMIVLTLFSLRHHQTRYLFISLTHLQTPNNYYSTLIISNKLFQLPLLLHSVLDYCKISMALQLGVNETELGVNEIAEIFVFHNCYYVRARSRH